MVQEKCCPRLKAAKWDKKEIEWKEKPFLKTKYCSIFHMPINIGRVVTKAMSEIEARNLEEDPPIMLSREESMFSSTLLISLKEDRKDLKTEKISGKFISMLFEGSYRETPKWIKKVQDYLKEQKKEIKELLFWYVTCPKCTKKYGSAQTVIFARIG